MDYPDIHTASILGYDTETTGKVYPRDKAFGFSVAVPGWSEYYDIRRNPEAVDWINDQVKKTKGRLACNASFDYKMSHNSGIYLPIDQLDDIHIRANLIDEHLFSYSVDDLAKKYLGKEKDTEIYEELASMFGGRATRNVQIGRIADAPYEVVRKYAKVDAELHRDLWLWQEDEIKRQDSDGKASVPLRNAVDFERSLIPTFVRAEMRGIRVDTAYAEEAADEIDKIREESEKRLKKIIGRDINVDSPKQIKEVFEPKEIAPGRWVANNGCAIGTTDKGGPSLKAEFLREMDDEKSSLILEIRSMRKMADTFLRGHVIGHSVGGRVYPSINQTKGEDGGTGTGRLSYQDPAMQQIPSRDKKKAAIIKPCFLPDEGMVWVDSDQNSFEVRIFAHLVNNPTIIQAYKDNPDTDFHQFVADLTGLVRNAEYSGQPNAKQLNLSMIFNSGDGAIADKMGMPWSWESFLPRGKRDVQENYITYKKAGPEAKKVIEMYHSRVQGVRRLAEGCKAVAESRGYIHTFKGRRLRFPRGYKSYKASGLLIQSTSAEYNKENWAIIEEELDGVGHLILNTHDSYSMCMPEDWRPHYKRIKNRIENETRARVPLILDFNGAGQNWWEALQG